MISKAPVCSVQNVHLSCIKIGTIRTDRNELPLEPRHLGVPLSKMVYEPMVCSVQIVLLSYTDTNTVSKWIEMGFHKTHIT
jgi:hypothetical protein